MTDDLEDITTDQIAFFGNILLEEFLSSGMPHPVETYPEECQAALRKADPQEFARNMAKLGYFSDYPDNRAIALIYAIYMWYHKVFN